MHKLRYILFALLFYACLPAHAQRITDGNLKTIVKSTLSAYEKKPFEKLYVQTDKPGYFAGDTIRLKGYLLNGDYRGPSVLSGMIYIELDNEAGKNVRLKIKAAVWTFSRQDSRNEENYQGYKS